MITDDYSKLKLEFHKKPELLAMGFTHYVNDPDNDKNAYFIYRFPVHKYKNKTTIEGSLITDILTGKIFDIEIYDKNTKEVYSPFYDKSCRYMYSDKFLNSMNKQIIKALKKVNAK